ncbi:hypothetical protein [Hamadaea tsunoensis]|uniref:hypothetical protein n=1 Tax=Hamadaea tsunoensis TaxID=53368 RepID=UPI0003FFB9E9|nr:hypothetical protein [Hamadaea tsunoensis]
MESVEARDQLILVERSAAAPYVQYPPTPWWYPPVVGAWTAALIGAFAWYRVNGAMFFASLAIVLAAEGWFLAWMRRRHGALPMLGHGRPPAEIGSVYRGYFAGLAVVVVVVAAAWWLGGVPVGAAVAFVAVTAGIALYERKYAAAAAKVRDRLG